MTHFRTHLLQLLEQEKIDLLLQHYLSQVDAQSQGKLYATLTAFQQRHQDLIALESVPKADLQKLRQRKNQLLFDLLDQVRQVPEDQAKPEDLPEEAAPPEPEPPQGIRDSSFQWHILILLGLVKAFIWGFLITLQETGGLSEEQYQGLTAILLPLLAGYLGIVFRYFMDHRHQTPVEETYTSRKVLWLTYAIFAFYVVAYFWVFRKEAMNAQEYKSLVNGVNAIEALLGGLIGYVIGALFHNKKKTVR